MWYTETHTRIDKWNVQPRSEHKMWNPRKTLVLHNSREMLAQFLNRRIRHLCTTYKMQNVTTSMPSMLCVYDVPVVRPKMIGYENLICNVVWCYGTCLHALCSLFFCLKAYSFFWYVHYAKCTNQDSNCVYAGTILWHKRWYNDTNMIWYVCNGRCRSLMCTSNVAGNTQRLVSIGKWRKMG